MSLTSDDVKRLADLARLELSETELANAEKELDSVLGYVNRLGEIDTKGVEPMTMPAKAEGWREDAVFPKDELERELILSNFPARRGDLLKTPGVFEKPKGGR